MNHESSQEESMEMHAIQPKQASMSSDCIVANSEVGTWSNKSATGTLAGYSSEMPIPSTDFVASNNRSNANQTTECSSMRTARPAARPPHPFFELRAQPFDMLPPCLIFLDGDGPADPLVARERRYVFPSRQCLSEISRKIMCDSSEDLNGCHRALSQAKGSSI